MLDNKPNSLLTPPVFLAEKNPVDVSGGDTDSDLNSFSYAEENGPLYLPL